MVDPHAVFIPWKSWSGRLRGQPATSDCSGNAGIVAGGDDDDDDVFVGRKGWIVAGSGSGLGRPEMEEKNRRKKKKKVKGGGIWMEDIGGEKGMV